MRELHNGAHRIADGDKPICLSEGNLFLLYNFRIWSLSPPAFTRLRDKLDGGDHRDMKTSSQLIRCWKGEPVVALNYIWSFPLRQHCFSGIGNEGLVKGQNAL